MEKLSSIEVPCDEARALAVKHELRQLASKVRIHIKPWRDVRAIAEGIVELLDEGYS